MSTLDITPLESRFEELFYRSLTAREKWLMREAFYHGVITGINRYIHDCDPSGKGLGLLEETRSGLSRLDSGPIPEDGDEWKSK